ncbi:NUDIX domain-containing protein [Pseudooceanicola nanhaiensis]|uniref:NUDIX domain-containing protein n=1 Tax=Pseudooceanicola nanhaiensis TaxID=375761 RepID=UPI001CD3035E|nr:NUDIX domain-containing protein [Pseudooceanicola nanhaiensis]MCA0921510.1 NUDIX domain-containing protein [Pseudooceanicola nanhaiensis]
MTDIFIYGTLRHQPLLEIVAGTPVTLRPGFLKDHTVVSVAGEDYPICLAAEGEKAKGAIVSLEGAALDRVSWYEEAFGYHLWPGVAHDAAGAEVAVSVYLPPSAEDACETPWSLSSWEAGWAEAARMAARECMGYFGQIPPDELGWRYPQVRARALSRLRAAQDPAPTLGRERRADQVELLSDETTHAGYYLTKVQQLRHPLYSGGMTEVLRREVFIAPDAAVILPYDPVKDTVLLVEQFRMGPYNNGSPWPWSLEPVAGRVDPGETAEACARREAVEEAGLEITDLRHVNTYYPSPGCISELLHTYVGLADLPDEGGTGFGVAGEGEDIRTHILPFERVMELVSSGEADNGPLILLMFWLQRERPRLRTPA